MRDIVIGWFRQTGFGGNVFTWDYYTSGEEVIKSGFFSFRNEKRKGLKLLFVVDKLNEGVHFSKEDGLKGCILLRNTVSNIIYYQQIGRVIDASATEQRVILDLVANVNNMKNCNLKRDLDNEIDKRKRGDYEKFGNNKDFDIESFGITDYVEDVVKIFENIDRKINENLKWDKEEIDFLINNVVYGIEYCANKLRRTYDSVQSKAYNLNLLQLQKNRWTDKDIEILKKIYPDDDNVCSKCQKVLNKSESSIRKKAFKLGLRKNNRKWTEDDINFLYKYYPTNGANYVSKKLNKSKNSVLGMAYKLNIFKENRWTKKRNKYY